MKCIYCNKQQQPLKIGGMVTITCCDKVQILKFTVRPNVRKYCANHPDVVLVDMKKG